MNNKHDVELADEERKQFKEMLKAGKHSAQKFCRAVSCSAQPISD